jgi:hypothetical protein
MDKDRKCEWGDGVCSRAAEYKVEYYREGEYYGEGESAAPYEVRYFYSLHTAWDSEFVWSGTVRVVNRLEEH